MIDMGKVFRESKLSKQIQAEFKAWDDSVRGQAQPKITLMQQKQQALQDSQSKLSAGEKDKLGKEVQDLQSELNTIQSKARQEYQEKQGAATQKMQAKLQPVIEALATENEWDLVMNKADQNAVWSSEALDQTDLILAKLDAQTPDAPAPAAVQPAASPAPAPPAQPTGKNP
jgi:Skp family chaperone for outer membrane proteins